MSDRQRIVVEVEAQVERAVELCSDLVRSVGVETGGIFDQGEALPETVSPDLELSAGVSQSCFDPDSFNLDSVTALKDLAASEQPISSQVDQALFTGFQLGELSLELLVQLFGQLLLVSQGGFELFANGVGEAVRETQGRIVTLNGFFDLPTGQVWQITLFLLTGSAEEVTVVLPGTTSDFGVDETTGATLFVAAITEQHALEVVMEDAVTVAT